MLQQLQIRLWSASIKYYAPDCGKMISCVISYFSCSYKKLKLPRWSGMIKSNAKPLLVKVYFAPLKQMTNLSGKTVKWILFLCFTRVWKSEYRACESFTLFHLQLEDQIVWLPIFFFFFFFFFYWTKIYFLYKKKSVWK